MMAQHAERLRQVRAALARLRREIERSRSLRRRIQEERHERVT
jgi:hypothetical protein